jgi:hypothetical protein
MPDDEAHPSDYIVLHHEAIERMENFSFRGKPQTKKTFLRLSSGARVELNAMHLHGWMKLTPKQTNHERFKRGNGGTALPGIEAELHVSCFSSRHASDPDIDFCLFSHPKTLTENRRAKRVLRKLFGERSLNFESKPDAGNS